MAEAESLETAAEHERILREIESTDTACIGPTLRYPGYRAMGRRAQEGTGGTPAGSFGSVMAGHHPTGACSSLWRDPLVTCIWVRRDSLRSPDVGSFTDRPRLTAGYLGDSPAS